jgi:hypothetical protein
MIFFAEAEPTPGRFSKSFSLAVFKSTFAFVSVNSLGVCAADFEVFASLDACPAEMLVIKTLNTDNATHSRRRVPAWSHAPSVTSGQKDLRKTIKWS